ncbi:MAG TPA: hypothetical protein H9863_06915 [Candidatus Odoribacter faecigallinarum]|uniref:Uncharacterized protein n=1 Tax=Candidatus Odoribacter faecigallinarum TaxID=2838706 RepID=A0A9D1V0L4_9BACT|nr:hypothetical protein [Candidatus Odoribacter faecigallinarum]
MTTIQLQQTVLRDVADLLDNQDAMQKLQRFLNKLKRETTTQEEMTAEEKEEILNDIRDGLRELKLVREGKLKLQSAREFLNELRG